MNHAKTGKIAIFSAERAVEDIHFLNQLRRDRLKRAEVALAMALGSLVLLNAVNQDLQAAVHPTVVQVESEATDLKRLPASLLLTCVDSSVQCLKELVLPSEEGLLINLVVPAVNAG